MLVREHEIVLATHDRRLERRRLRAVAPEPLPEVEVVDGVVGVAVATQPVRDHPGQHGPDEVDQVVEPAGARVGADRRREPGEQGSERAVDRRRAAGAREPASPCRASSNSCWLTASTVGAIVLTAPLGACGGEGESESRTAGVLGRAGSSEA